MILSDITHFASSVTYIPSKINFYNKNEGTPLASLKSGNSGYSINYMKYHITLSFLEEWYLINHRNEGQKGPKKPSNQSPYPKLLLQYM